VSGNLKAVSKMSGNCEHFYTDIYSVLAAPTVIYAWCEQHNVHG